jgi:hypothetical protein
MMMMTTTATMMMELSVAFGGTISRVEDDGIQNEVGRERLLRLRYVGGQKKE